MQVKMRAMVEATAKRPFKLGHYFLYIIDSPDRVYAAIHVDAPTEKLTFPGLQVYTETRKLMS